MWTIRNKQFDILLPPVDTSVVLVDGEVLGVVEVIVVDVSVVGVVLVAVVDSVVVVVEVVSSKICTQ